MARLTVRLQFVVPAADCHVPYEPTLEDAVLPQVTDIEVAARDLLAF